MDDGLLLLFLCTLRTAVVIMVIDDDRKIQTGWPLVRKKNPEMFGSSHKPGCCLGKFLLAGVHFEKWPRSAKSCCVFIAIRGGNVVGTYGWGGQWTAQISDIGVHVCFRFCL